MTHTHEYKYWHSHKHKHLDNRNLLEADVHVGAYIVHDEGHYHIFAQTHKHGKGISDPHSHKEKQFHPGKENIEHHTKE